MTIAQISPFINGVVGAGGTAQVMLSPPSGTRWQLALASTSVSTGTAAMALYRGSASGPVEIIDSTPATTQASSGRVAGLPYFPGQALWAVFTGGTPGAVVTLQAFGQQGSRTDPFDPAPMLDAYPPLVTSITVPTGATTGPRIVVGTTIPAVLVTWGAANTVTFTAVMVFYWNNTDFWFVAVGTFGGQPCRFSGTYDTTNNVYVLDRVLDTGAGAIETRLGSYALNAFQELFTTQQLAMQIGDGSNIGDKFTANCDSFIFGTLRSKTNSTTTETWHGINALGYTAPWSDFGGTQQVGQYRLQPDGTVHLRGDLKTSANVTSGASIFTLPAGYVPTTNLSFPATGVTTGGSMVTATLNVQTSGLVSYSNTSALATLALLPLGHVRFSIAT